MQSTLELSELDRMVGRLFMAGMPGPELDGDTESLIRDRCLGGVILFARNIVDPLQLARLCNDLQEAAMERQGIPLFLAVDQEGGRVARLKSPFSVFPGNSAIGEDRDPVGMAAEFASVTAREMALVGLNMDMAPVVDVRRGEPERHLNGRLFSDDPEKVSLLGRTVVRGLQQGGVMAVAKHFPGLGRAPLDPHHRLPTIAVPMDEMEEIDLPPFRAAVEEGVSAVMTSHAVYPAVDPDLPGTLSPKVVTGLLRETLGFEGLIITDDLEMGAIGRGWGVSEGAVRAFEAGADILLICEDQARVVAAMDALRNGLLRSDLPIGRLHGSVKRIMEAKERLLHGGVKVSISRVREYFGDRTAGS